mmetsp:Transcript_64977/g.152909  ORF Transcript_64977/g.152909 Transcript_64977/m.152909 type:complete len:144 (-) Transcript_64977:925-1356(-)
MASPSRESRESRRSDRLSARLPISLRFRAARRCIRFMYTKPRTDVLEERLLAEGCRGSLCCDPGDIGLVALGLNGRCGDLSAEGRLETGGLAGGLFLPNSVSVQALGEMLPPTIVSAGPVTSMKMPQSIESPAVTSPGQEVTD